MYVSIRNRCTTGDTTGDNRCTTGDPTGETTGDTTGNATGDTTGNTTSDITGGTAGDTTGGTACKQARYSFTHSLVLLVDVNARSVLMVYGRVIKYNTVSKRSFRF